MIRTALTAITTGRATRSRSARRLSSGGLRALVAGTGFLALWTSAVQAHFPILIHDGTLTSTGGKITMTFAVGHPFELELVPAQRPERVQLIDPRGRGTNLTQDLTGTLFRGDTQARAWQVRIEPERGDSWLAVDAEPQVEPSEKLIYQEYIKVCVHRERQGGWTTRTGQPVEIVPLTRPYGLRPGLVFTGRLMRGAAAVADTEVYFERLNDDRPEPGALPAEPLITFAVRTDADGRFVLSLPEPGWWVIGAYVEGLGTVRRDGVDYRLEGFAGVWVRVEP